MLPPLPGGMVGSIVSTDWFLPWDAPRRGASRPRLGRVPPLLILTLSLARSARPGAATTAWRPTSQHLWFSDSLAARAPCLSWRAQPNVFWLDYCLRLGHRCGRRPRSPTPSRLSPYQGTVSHPGPPLTDRILCQPTQRPSLTPLLSLIFCLLGFPDNRRCLLGHPDKCHPSVWPAPYPAPYLCCVFSPHPGLGCR